MSVRLGAVPVPKAVEDLLCHRRVLRVVVRTQHSRRLQRLFLLQERPAERGVVRVAAARGLPGYFVTVIIWLNGGFGAGKTTLAEELHRRLPDAVVYDPEDVGLMLWKWMRPNDDFQHLPSWRELVVTTALSLRRHHADTLIVPMSLIRDAYRAEILDGLADAGEEVLHVFLEADAGVLRKRLNARVPIPGNPETGQSAREWALSRLDAAVAAAARQPGGTLMLRSDRLTPAELADEVLAAAGLRH
jgi:predicted kinase